MKPRSKYNQFTINLPDKINSAVVKECFEQRVSKQDFIRELIRDYFWRKKGFDIFYQPTNGRKNESDAG